METNIYQLGFSYIVLRMPEEMERPENLEKFKVTDDSELQRKIIAAADAEDVQPEEFQAEFHDEFHVNLAFYILEYTDNILEIENVLRKQQKSPHEVIRDAVRIFHTETGECRRTYFPGMGIPYAASLEEPGNRFHIWIDRMIGEMLKYDTIFTSILSLERQMIKSGAMILHSAYMCYDGTAVLFSAPSETGKSTQAALWEKYRGTRTINGDRSLLMRREDGWYAAGWPVCGSSEICHNESYPIRAIVMLKQAPENKVYPLKGFKAVRELMEQITINTWDSGFQMKVMDSLEMLLAEIPVYCLECNISEGAVECLEQVLEK